ncbi:Helix-turn-helix domain-containing protein [Ruminococcus sp. YE71]|uniref:helix-turn-helix transcriptional regulator n=1 Tax=unclassified Ruminococcus TaxID=2608920 RepID=UPI0008850221|nr:MULTISPECIES: helix-turn-helix domain-containing protein [unclassified Ruminococcus]SDA18245.1 Helix-turn-helix domain-containing protein [Ruminococcus sp. YE78]SFW30230.1 Helix-turn-helix domain-containing protein [Ruminococcus sp. YE71]
MTFAEKLRHIRVGQHKTQAEVAKALGVSSRTIILYEQGSRKPRSEDVYERLAELFDAPPSFWQNESEDDFQIASMYAHGNGGRVQADKLVSEMAGLFAGGKLSEEDADEVMLALQKAYWAVKEKQMTDRTEAEG